MAQVTVEAQYVADTAQYVQALRRAALATQSLADSVPGQVKAQGDLAKGLKDTGAEAAKTAQGFSILRNALGTAIGVAAVNILGKITGNIKGFAVESFNAAARVEELDIAMEAIGKSTGVGTDAIREATNAIRDNGIELGAAQQIAIEFAQNQLDLASASKVARVAQDLAVIAGQNSTATTMMLTQAIISGNSQLLKSAGISKYASEAYQEYADSVGKTLPQLTAVERQQAVTNMILREGEAVAGTYEGAMNSAGKVMRSFARIINDIQIEIGRVLLQALGPLIKSTYDLMKAFSKSLRDGGALSDMMSNLAESAAKVSEPLVEMINNLTESVKSGEALAKIGDHVDNLIPLMMELFNTVKNLVDVFGGGLLRVAQILMPVLESMLNVIQPLSEAFAKLPKPVKDLIAILVLLEITAKKTALGATLLGVTWTQAAAKVTSGYAMMTAAGRTAATRTATYFAAMRTQANVFAATMRTVGAGVALSFRTMATAAKGFMASMGPVGLALIGVSLAFETFSGRSAEAKAFNDEMVESLDKATGGFTQLSEEILRTKLLDAFSAEDLQTLQKFGISLSEMSAAMIEGGAAASEMEAKLRSAFIAAAEDTSDGGIFGPDVKVIENAMAKYEELGAASAAANAQGVAAAQEAAAAAQAKAQAEYNAMEVSRAALMTTQQLTHVEVVQSQHRTKSHAALQDAIRATEQATIALDNATSNMLSAMSKEASYDKARQGILNLKKELSDGEKKLKGYSQAALNNRAAIREAAQGYIDYANSLTDPIERQKALEEGQKKIRKAIKEAGLDPNDSDILKTMQAEAQQSKETVDEFAKQRDKALQYGNDVGKNFVDGIIKELRARKSNVDASAAGLVAGMPGAANDAIGASSPSKEAIKVAKNFVDGLVVGIREDKKRAEMEVSELGEALISKIEEKMSQVREVLAQSAAGFANIGEASGGVRAKFGLPSQIMEMFGEGADISGVLGGYESLSQSVSDIFAPMLDPDLVPKKQLRDNEKLYELHMMSLDEMTQTAVNLVQERESLNKQMNDLDAAYQKQVQGINDKYGKLLDAADAEAKSIEASYAAATASINARFDAADKAAEANIKRITDHYDDLIPKLKASLAAATKAYDQENKVLEGLVSDRDKFLDNIGSGFRGFLNNLKVGDKSANQIKKITRKIVDGLEILTEETVSGPAAGGFAEALRGRLDAIRQFSGDIQSLLSRGLDPTLVKDFVAAGVDSAGETVAALAAGSNESIAEINAAQSELSALVSSFQQTASQQWFDYGIAQQEAIVHPLRVAADEAQGALEQAEAARAMELEAANAQKEALRVARAAELAAAQAHRDTELARVRAHQETLRNERDAELLAAKTAYDTERKEIEDRLAAIDLELQANAERINKYFTDLSTTLLPYMKKFGTDIINGLMKGLKKREPALYAKARAIADRIRAEIAAAFNFGSPSKVTMKMGEQIAQGLIVGMNNQMKNVAFAASALADQAMIPIQVPNVAGLVSNPVVSSSQAFGTAGPAGSTVNITVNAGMGADGSQIGREIISHIRQYERRNGPVFVSTR